MRISLLDLLICYYCTYYVVLPLKSYREVAAASYTPNSSSLSPESSCLQSPVSYTWESSSPCAGQGGPHRGFPGGGGASGAGTLETRSPPGTAADLQEFLQVGGKVNNFPSLQTILYLQYTTIR